MKFIRRVGVALAATALSVGIVAGAAAPANAAKDTGWGWSVGYNAAKDTGWGW